MIVVHVQQQYSNVAPPNWQVRRPQNPSSSQYPSGLVPAGTSGCCVSCSVCFCRSLALLLNSSTTYCNITHRPHDTCCRCLRCYFPAKCAAATAPSRPPEACADAAAAAALPPWADATAPCCTKALQQLAHQGRCCCCCRHCYSLRDCCCCRCGTTTAVTTAHP